MVLLVCLFVIGNSDCRRGMVMVGFFYDVCIFVFCYWYFVYRKVGVMVMGWGLLCLLVYNIDVFFLEIEIGCDWYMLLGGVIDDY